MKKQPSVGRIVHYQAYGTPNGEYRSEPRAAIVTSVRAGMDHNPLVETFPVDLCVLNPTGMFFNLNVRFSETPKPGCWNWPPRVE
jgi:hypothetical protein